LRLGESSIQVLDKRTEHSGGLFLETPDASPAVMGVGYIVGPKVSSILFSGAVTGWLLMVPLAMFQFSCASMKEAPAEAEVAEAPVEAEPAADEALLLAGKHDAAGISCNDCHEEDPPAGSVATDTCLTCHEDYQELAASYLDPHNAHVTYSNCSDCHHVHRESEKICQGCHHTFNIQAP
jgi:fumarate reductase flavoprotein subunit